MPLDDGGYRERMRDKRNRRLEQHVRTTIRAGGAPWHCIRCRRYVRTRIGFGLHVLTCREVAAD
jgi:hypothetical protein